ncbi:uncharacterized protein CC84DRAFT_562220 [Paraphaeosphaeria sporulosa]|uniref:Uncharacterized protein n=1 Tax=Paraphaeosphaeria sporulosa TaxID=1460663 RepID=A0A177CMT0_9PLEO|nr:uncharacterized protein CC84DRAFT_562220 [Paraphaeosphaeria sporulosa]OAG08190.1 hypothetical protein CC84DRAFT_562220 [Paraphaeosphaeria sporulosa]
MRLCRRACTPAGRCRRYPGCWESGGLRARAWSVSALAVRLASARQDIRPYAQSTRGLERPRRHLAASPPFLRPTWRDELQKCPSVLRRAATAVTRRM